MQIGIFTVGDVTTDPTTGRTPTEHERIKATVAIAKKAEEVGLDVFALGEHHNPPFFSSSPTTTLAYIAAQTERLVHRVAEARLPTDFGEPPTGIGGPLMNFGGPPISLGSRRLPSESRR